MIFSKPIPLHLSVGHIWRKPPFPYKGSGQMCCGPLCALWLCERCSSVSVLSPEGAESVSVHTPHTGRGVRDL